jgi:hypothetical protein
MEGLRVEARRKEGKERKERKPRPPAHLYMGTFECFLCGKETRVYEWLPQYVACAKCKRKIIKKCGCGTSCC